MSDTTLLVVSGAVALWVSLAIIGGERERTLREIEIRRRSAPPPPEAAEAPVKTLKGSSGDIPTVS